MAEISKIGLEGPRNIIDEYTRLSDFSRERIAENIGETPDSCSSGINRRVRRAIESKGNAKFGGRLNGTHRFGVRGFDGKY
ncbi:hypothetical protein N9J72_02750 [Candidatus Gracilibacteria bacterium]|nr:hypothetical protein [Candidatus Gracilibacteria bacterium]